MSGTPERGNRGGEPAAMARAAAVMPVSGRAIERPATRASTPPTSSAMIAAPGHRALGPADDVVHLAQVRGDADRARAAGDGDVEHPPADGVALAGGDPGPSGERGADLRTLAVVLDGGERARGEIAVGPDPAGLIDDGDAAVVLSRGEPADAFAPGGGVGAEGLADEAGLTLQGALDLADQVAAQGPLRRQQQDRHREHQHQDGPRDEPGGERHLARTPRSVPLKR